MFLYAVLLMSRLSNCPFVGSQGTFVAEHPGLSLRSSLCSTDNDLLCRPFIPENYVWHDDACQYGTTTVANRCQSIGGVHRVPVVFQSFVDAFNLIST
jgi:hypothetical protein